MLRHDALRRLVTSACAGSALFALAPRAGASNPLEYPDNGAAAFSRGGAWLATANDPIAAHYNPAAMALQSNGLSLDILFAYNSVCFLRQNPGEEGTGPTQGTTPYADYRRQGGARYRPVCNETTVQPRILPSLGIVWRASERLALGFAVVPPATYGSTTGEWPTISKDGGRLPDRTVVDVPAPYRYMTVGARATIVHPTFSVGYAVVPNIRVGAGFIWSIGVIDTESFSARTVFPDQVGDDATLDTHSRLRTTDYFVPGFVASIDWSLSPFLDAAIWGRWVDAIDTSEGRVDLISNYYNETQTRPAPVCRNPDPNLCPSGQSVPDRFEEPDFQRFRYVATPPEIRVGLRYHQPRRVAKPAEVMPTKRSMVRDPLRNDVFDVELNGSWTMNSVADTITVRFRGSEGRAVIPVRPEGNLPPRADRPTGYKDSFGVRLGGQYNLVQNRFGLRAGTWFETAAADDEWLNIAPVPAARGGFGGGIVYRHGSLDFSIGYQRHYSLGMNNEGNGRLKAGAGTQQGGGEFRIGNEPDEQQFRTFHVVNGGRVEQSANVFTLGAVFRF